MNERKTPVVKSFTASSKDDRCLEVWFANEVTEGTRAWLLEAINEKALRGVAQAPTTSDKLAYTSTGQIAACKCGSFPTLYGDGARPDDGYRSLWCQTCMEHVTSMMPSEREVIDHWNALREQEHAGEASSVPSTDRQPPNSICKFCDRRTFEPCSSYIRATTACTFSLPSSAQDNSP